MNDEKLLLDLTFRKIIINIWKIHSAPEDKLTNDTQTDARDTLLSVAAVLYFYG